MTYKYFTKRIYSLTKTSLPDFLLHATYDSLVNGHTIDIQRIGIAKGKELEKAKEYIKEEYYNDFVFLSCSLYFWRQNPETQKQYKKRHKSIIYVDLKTKIIYSTEQMLALRFDLIEV